jgi:hypothetical protein
MRARMGYLYRRIRYSRTVMRPLALLRCARGRHQFEFAPYCPVCGKEDAF